MQPELKSDGLQDASQKALIWAKDRKDNTCEQLANDIPFASFFPTHSHPWESFLQLLGRSS